MPNPNNSGLEYITPEYGNPGKGGPLKIPRLDINDPSNSPLKYAYDPSYDQGYRSGMDQEQYRATNQAWYSQVYNGFLSRGLSIGTKVGQGLAAVLVGIPTAVSQRDISKIWDNPMFSMLAGADERLKEMFPVYRSQEYQEGDLLGKMGTSTFWTTDFFDGLAFAASAYAPGGLLGKLIPAGSSAIKSTELGARMLKAFNKVGATSHNANLTLSTMYNTVAEAAVEASQTQQEIQAIYESQGMDKNKAKELASRAAGETFWWNSAVLLVPNFIQNKFFHSDNAGRRSSIHDHIWNNKGSAAGLSNLKNVWGSVGKGIVSEGLWEENVQFAIQNYERNFAKGYTDASMLEGVASNMVSNLKGFAKSFLPGFKTDAVEDEAATSIFLGSVIGSMFGGGSAIMEAKQNREYAKIEEGRYKNLFDQLGPAAANLFVEDRKALLKKSGSQKVKVGDQEVEVPQYETYTDADGNVRFKFDQDALNKKVTNELTNAMHWDASIAAAYNNDALLDTYNNRMALAAFAHKLASNPSRYSAEEIDKYLESLTEIGTEEAKATGSNTLIAENMKTVKEDVRRLQELDQKYNLAKDALENPDEYNFKQFSKRTKYYLDTKMQSLQELLGKATKQETIDGITSMMEDTQSLIDAFENDLDGIRKEYNSRVATPFKDQVRLSELTKKTTRTKEESEEMDALTYKLTEQLGVNGEYKWVSDDASSGYGVSVPIARQTKINPGLRDSYSLQMGQQELALADINAGLERGDNPRELAREFTSKVFDEQRSQNTQTELISALGKEEESLLQNAEDLQNESLVVDELLSSVLISGEEVPLQDVANNNGVDPKSIVDKLAARGVGIDPTIPITREDAEAIQDSLVSVIEENDGLTTQVMNAVNEVRAYKTAVSNPQDSIKAKRVNAFKNAADKDAFLIREFFDNEVVAPFDSLMGRFNTNPETFSDKQQYTTVLSILNKALAAFKSRTDLSPSEKKAYIQEIEGMMEQLTSTVYPAMMKFFERQGAKQIQSNRASTNYSLEALGFTYSKDELYNALVTILGEERVSTLMTNYDEATIESYDGVGLIIDAIKDIATPEQLAQVLQLVEQKGETLLSQIKTLLPESVSQRPHYFEKSKYYLQAPAMIIQQLIAWSFPEQAKDQSSRIFKYLQDHDLDDLVANDTLLTDLSDSEKTMLFNLRILHLKLQANREVAKALSSVTVKHSELTAAKKDLFVTTKPSLQQNIILTSIFRFLFSKTTLSAYENWFIFRGIGGSGKTFLVSKAATALLQRITGKKSTENILAFGHTRETSKNVNEAIFGNISPDTQLQTFLDMNDTQLSTIDLIVIDEVFALTTSQLEAVQAKLNEHYQATNRVIKVIAMGDPSQVVAQPESIVMSSSAYKASHTIPLTTNFRTNIGAINSYIDNYRLNPSDVSSASGQANLSEEELLANPSKGFGVHITSADTILDMANTPSTRSRVLIVSSFEEVQRYSGRVSIPVRTPAQVQGFPWDEVYVIANKPALGQSNIDINRAIYTAGSRAKSFLVMDETLGGLSLPADPQMNESIQQSTDELNQLNNIYEEQVKSTNDISNALNGVTAISAKDLTSEVIVDKTSEDAPYFTPDTARGEVAAYAKFDELESPATIITLPPTAEQVSEVSYNIAHPTNYVLTGPNPPVARNTTGHIVKVRRDGKDFYYILAPTVGDPRRYVAVGVLGNADFSHESLGEYLTSLVSSTARYIDYSDLDNTSLGTMIENIAPLSLATVTIKDYTPLKAQYNLSQFHEGIDVIDDVIIKFYNSFFGKDSEGRVTRTKEATIDPSKDWVVNGKVNWDVLRGKVQVRIYSRNSADAPAFVKKGVPYLIINNPDQAGSTSTSKPMFIRLEPARFSTKSRHYQPIRNFTEAAVVLEELVPELQLGSSELHDFINNYAKDNFEVAEDNLASDRASVEERHKLVKKNDAAGVQEYYAFEAGVDLAQVTAAVDQMVTLGFGVDLRLKHINNEEEAASYVGQTLQGHKIVSYRNRSSNPDKPSKIWLLEYKADSTEDLTLPYQELVISSRKGAAQVALNNLARANDYIGGQKLRIRMRDRYDKLISFSQSRSLFGTFDETTGEPTDAIDWNSFYEDMGKQLNITEQREGDNSDHLYNHIMKHHSGETVVTPVGEFTINSKDDINDIIRAYSAKPLSTDILVTIVGDQMFDASGYHSIYDEENNITGLREPLSMNTINWLGNSNTAHANPKGMNEDARADLNKVLAHSFIGMQKTQVTLGLTVKVPTPDSPAPTTVGEVLESIKPSKTKWIKELVALLSSTKAAHSVKVVFVPTIDNSRNKLKTVYDKATGITTIYSTIDFNGINSDRLVLSLFLHEVIHAITLKAITNYKSKKATPEETVFYKSVYALQRRFNAHITLSLKEKLEDYYQSTEGKYNVAEFIANLSNPKFHKLASTISLADKVVSILNAFVEALANLLGFSKNDSYYDAAFKVLKNYIDSTQGLEVEVAPQVSFEQRLKQVLPIYEKAITDEVSNLKELISQAEDEGDDDRVDELNRQLLITTHIYSPTTKAYNSEWLAKDAAERLEDVNTLLATKGLSPDSTSQAAFYVARQQSTLSSPGMILTTQAVTSFVESTFPEYNSKELKGISFILRSVIQNQLVDPDSDVLPRLIHLGKLAFEGAYSEEFKLSLVDLFYNDILENYDREKLRRAYTKVTNAEMVDTLLERFDELPEIEKFTMAAISAYQAEDKVAFIISNTVDNNIERYKAAKQFILDKIYANLNTPSGLVRTKQEIINEIASEVSPKNTASPTISKLKNDLRDAKDRLLVLSNKLHNLSFKEKQEYSKLINKTIPKLEASLFGISSLGTINKRTGTLLLKDVLSDIYPKTQWGDDTDLSIITEDLEYIINDRGDRELLESANINEYIRDYSKSKEATLSESLKDFLAFIPDPLNTGAFLNAGAAYMKTLQLILSLDNDLSKSGLAYTRRQLEDLVRKGLSRSDEAVARNLLDLIRRVTSSQVTIGGDNLGQNYSIVSKVTPAGRVLYLGLFSKNKDVTKMSYEEALTHSDVETSPRATESSTELFNWLSSKVQGFDMPTYNALFKKHEATNILREIYNSMASMKETDLYIATRSNKRGTRFIYQRSKASGISFGIKEDMKTALRDLHSRMTLDGKSDMLTAFKSRFNTKVGTESMYSLLSRGNAQQKADSVKFFFKQLLPVDLVDELYISTETLSKIAEDVSYFIDRTGYVIQRDSDAVADTEVNESEESVNKTTKEFIDIESWLDTEMDGYLTRFSEMITKSTDLVRNVSVKDSKGNKFFKIHESTFADDVLNSLISMSKSEEFKGTQGSNKYHSAPAYLRTTYFKDNIFVNGINSVLGKGEHEAALNLDNGSVTPLTRENMYWFYHREFIQGFLSGAQQFNGKAYFAFTYPPSDKPKHPLIKIGILDNNQIKEGVVSALQQLLKQKGSTTTIVNYNKSVSEDLFRNFEIAAETGMELTAENIPAMADAIMELMTKKASEALDDLLSVELGFDASTWKILSKLQPKFGLQANYNEVPEKFYNRNKDGDYVVDKSLVLPAFDLFFKNHYVNSYFLNQLISGDFHFYKNSADIVKREAGPLGPGIRPLVDPNIGMAPTFKMLVLDDTNVEVEEQSARLHKLIFGDKNPTKKQQKEFDELLKYFDKYQITDAQGFMVPSRYHQLSKGFGRSWGMGHVMKPMYFEVQDHKVSDDYSTGKPIYVKYSVINLENSLVERFPLLRKLRKRMEALQVDELVFKSAVKAGMVTPLDREGKPVSLTFKDFIGMNAGEIMSVNEYSVPPILTLNNSNYRLQLNPASDPNKLVTIYSQLMYFLNINEQDPTKVDAAKTAYAMVAELIKMGKESFLDKVNSPTKLRSFLRKKFDGPGAERALDLLQAGISLNHPLLEKKAIVALASGMESATVKIKFGGGKLVLQTAEGIRMGMDLDDQTYNAGNELEYKRGTINGVDVMYAEVIVPEALLTREQREAILNKRDLFVYGDGVGYRIPSTELHSAIPFKIVGTYSNENTNVIIAPKDIVAIHGSDFDVDALFVISRDIFTKDNYSITTAEAILTIINSYAALQESINSSLKELDDPAEKAKLEEIFDKMGRKIRLLETTEESQNLPENFSSD